MGERSYVLLFHNLCYTHIEMQTDSPPEARASWPKWIEFLRRRKLEARGSRTGSSTPWPAFWKKKARCKPSLLFYWRISQHEHFP